MPNPSDDPTQRIAELEAELEALKVSSSTALELSWLEVENLQKKLENARVAAGPHKSVPGPHESISASHEPISVSHETKGTVDGGLHMTAGSLWKDTTLSVSSITVATYESDLSDGSAEQSSGSSALSSILSHSLASLQTRRTMKRNINSSNNAPSEIEVDLLRQLEVMQEDKLRTVQELELKMRQRESAIATLERTVIVQNETIKNLRNEIDSLRAAQVPPPQIERIKAVKSPEMRMRKAMISPSARSIRASSMSMISQSTGSSKIAAKIFWMSPGNDNTRKTLLMRDQTNERLASSTSRIRGRSMSPSSKYRTRDDSGSQNDESSNRTRINHSGNKSGNSSTKTSAVSSGGQDTHKTINRRALLAKRPANTNRQWKSDRNLLATTSNESSGSASNLSSSSPSPPSPLASQHVPSSFTFTQPLADEPGGTGGGSNRSLNMRRAHSRSGSGSPSRSRSLSPDEGPMSCSRSLDGAAEFGDEQRGRRRRMLLQNDGDKLDSVP